MGFVEYYSAFKAYSDINSEEYRRRIENLEPLLMKFMKTRGRVLDLACGVGGFSFLLEDLGFEVVGLDNSRFMLEKAREFAKEKESRVEFIEGDARELPFENDSFDYVLFIDSLVHFEPQDLAKVFKETARVLKPGGKFILQFTDLRALLPVLMNGQVVGAEYWVNKVLPDQEEKTVVIEFQSEKDSFRVKFNVWGKMAVELLAKLYFRKEGEEKLNEHSYFQVYGPKK
ncbi:SAM-dependent methyltransferase, UbiE/COQ5 family [Thermococcus kodakarensis KOD1]|uniref:SAM-dependent methyltransferase, UbiE/COQ5 family n=1 Tax=Thermococcus kodakarensis (strain ATCC BAA-918 / JCM 12380 / KOD1) TaxID=69014 RepID=Q5JHQ2_THEKO|nr:class I SAM-dependent methyltransferase [Thermococcus kodakarensis]WCN28071.1 class I SAM-dependent methyltransferase [Thermococcus kodakarensis]WCN30368.1 class I SAM-dependent methyltransferase [Thermococcus kodakarensis]BAD86430.1 SAM-dependent methyltransferase, UbiE/COQ5 family [Thermococcus kodakarensis KOD1]